MWAVAVPVTVRYEGDPLPGGVLGIPTPSAQEKSPLLACQVSAATGFHRGNPPDASCGVPVRASLTSSHTCTP